jgi:hypothetical protein
MKKKELSDWEVYCLIVIPGVIIILITKLIGIW